MAELQLRDMPLTLEKLTNQLHGDSKILEDTQMLVSESKDTISAYVSAMENEGNDVLKKREDLVKAKHPSKVEVIALQKSLSGFKVALSSATKSMKAFETKVHSKLENLRQKRQQNETEVEKLKSQQRRLTQDIEELEKKIKEHQTEEMDKFKRAVKYNDEALTAVEKGRDTLKAGLVGTTAGSVGALLLAPFSGGLSLVVAGAAAAVTVGTSVTAISLKHGADNLQKQAGQEISDATEIRRKITARYEEMFSIAHNILIMEVQIRDLERTTLALENINQFLLLTIGEMNTTEKHVQDLEAAMLGASQHGDCFQVLQRAFVDYPDLVEETAVECMIGLKDKWDIVMTNIWKTCRKM